MFQHDIGPTIANIGMIALDTAPDRRAWSENLRIRPIVFRAGLSRRAATGTPEIARRPAFVQKNQASKHDANDSYFRR